MADLAKLVDLLAQEDETVDSNTTGEKAIFFISKEEEDKFTANLEDESIDFIAQHAKKFSYGEQEIQGYGIKKKWPLEKIQQTIETHNLLVCVEGYKSPEDKNIFQALDSGKLVAAVFLETDQGLGGTLVEGQPLTLKNWDLPVFMP